MFDKEALDQIKAHGLDTKTVENQIENFKNGFPFTSLSKAATIGHGIASLSVTETEKSIATYDENSHSKSIVKFVPASGAASRMFKALFEFIQSYDGSDESYEKLIADQSAGSVFEFLKQLENFAFYDELSESFKSNGITLSEAHVSRKYVDIIEHLLTEKGLGYGELPKGLLSFHKYGETSRTPIEEHIVEGAQYASSGNTVKIHFTLSPEHIDNFEEHITRVRHLYESEFSVKLEISHSIQKPSTDTIAVDLENQPFTNSKGKILFRPAGHGALLENLNDIDADVVFLKNIDNLVPDRLKADTIKFKKAIGGRLLELQQKTFYYLEQLDNGTADIDEISSFISENLGFRTESKLSSDQLHSVLNRPIRVCGMVKNEGKAGGGPFWVSQSDGSESLQIVESAQVDMDDPDQQKLFNESTHFNPVDVVCTVKDYKGDKFDLLSFRDPSSGFITHKSKDGRELKAQELPGLWNGSMAFWNTQFVEVPLITFNPVKTVNDLLKDEHQ